MTQQALSSLDPGSSIPLNRASDRTRRNIQRRNWPAVAFLALPTALALLAIGWAETVPGEIQRHLVLGIAVFVMLAAISLVQTQGTRRTISTNLSQTTIRPDTKTMTNHASDPTSASPRSTHVLVDGLFSGGDAKDLLLAQIDSQLNVHKLRSLRSMVHNERPDTEALQACEELKLRRQELRLALARAATEGRKVRVRSTVELHIEDESAEAAPAHPVHRHPELMAG